MIDSVTERRQAELSDRARVNARWMSGVFLLVLAPAAGSMSGAMFLVMVTAVNVAQVVFDMAMAPFEEAAHTEADHRPVAHIDAERRAAGKGAVSPTRRWDVSDAIRKGAPSSVRRDLYFYFMEGSWTRVFVAFTFLFLVGNVFFALLFVLEAGAVANADPNSFLDAFFFSVQTMSTIGYGTLAPATPYGNLIVTVEAAVGIIGVAIVTGLVFAKASRPKASVLFSGPIVLTTMNGKKTLVFRVGNARGNEVVDASMDFTVMRDHVSEEGHHLRQLHELKLKRKRSPMFVLSWVVMHEIDEDSPLADVDWQDPGRDVLLFVATLIGHDGTYGQTIYSRKVYHPEDIRVGHRFVDVLSSAEDGRLMIDFTHFDKTRPDETAADQAESITKG
jgi:inward rectifier potassium channel